MAESITVSYERIEDALYLASVNSAYAPAGGRPRSRVWHPILGGIIGFGIVVSLLIPLPQAEHCIPWLVAGLAVMCFAWYVSALLNRWRVRGLLAPEQERRGPVSMEFDASGMRSVSSFGMSHLMWRGVDAVLDLGTGSGLKSGTLVYPIPNDALPRDMTPQAFRDRLVAWRTAA